MKVKYILSCVCCDHKPNAGDSVFFGMPQLKVAGGQLDDPFCGDVLYSAYCPNCGIGGSKQFKSAYLALKHWNEFQERCKNTNIFKKEK